MSDAAATILVIGTFDSKSDEYTFLRDQLHSLGCDVVTVNVGVMTPQCDFPIDVAAEDVSQAGGKSLEELRAADDRGAAMKCMSIGAAQVVADLARKKQIDGVIGMGGSGGTSVICSAMRALPIGIPKVCVSTVASSDTSPYVGAKDIVLIPSVTDISGLNRVSRRVIAQAAAAVCGICLLYTSDAADE